MKTHADTLRAFLDAASAELDRSGKVPVWSSWRRVVLASPAVGVLTLVSCGGETTGSEVPIYGAPYESQCNNDLDDDGDGKTDCDDSDCNTRCGPVYGVPLEDCARAGDEDGDGKADCADEDCRSICGQPDYGMPLMEDCGTPGDEDGDGQADCADEDCGSLPMCAPPPYGIPYEYNCSDGLDNDANGMPDCHDPVCATEPQCFGVERCFDGEDNDGDGAADCADTADCLEFCSYPVYGIPLE